MTGKRGKTPPDEGVMPDLNATEAERPWQGWFTLRTLAGCILLLLAINEANWRLIRPSQRVEYGPRSAILHFAPVPLGSGPLVAGAWEVTSADPRFGGLSALALDGEELVALTDAGAVIRFPRPRSGAVPAHIREVPGGPRTPWLKANRDIEALVADPAGRGWWAAFEYAGELWLFDRQFRRSLERIEIGSFGRSGNAGIEGLAANRGDLLLFAETGGKVVRLSGSSARIERIAGARARVSAAASLAPGRILVIERKLTPLGFRNALVELAGAPGGYRRLWALPIPAGPLDNFEGLAIDRSGGRTRLWLVSDDNFQKPFRTVVLALDLQPATGSSDR